MKDSRAKQWIQVVAIVAGIAASLQGYQFLKLNAQEVSASWQINQQVQTPDAKTDLVFTPTPPSPPATSQVGDNALSKSQWDQFSIPEKEDYLKTLPSLVVTSNTQTNIKTLLNSTANDLQMFTKVGDSRIEVYTIFHPLAKATEKSLGDYAYLIDTIRFYQKGFDHTSLAVGKGYNSATVLDPSLGRENPLDDELNSFPDGKKPAFAFIWLGANDVKVLTEDKYLKYMREIIRVIQSQHIVPIIILSPSHHLDKYFERALNFSYDLYALSGELAVPVLNLWNSLSKLDNYGLGPDDMHFTGTAETLAFDRQKDEGNLNINIALLSALYELHKIYPAS